MNQNLGGSKVVPRRIVSLDTYRETRGLSTPQITGSWRWRHLRTKVRSNKGVSEDRRQRLRLNPILDKYHVKVDTRSSTMRPLEYWPILLLVVAALILVLYTLPNAH